MATRTQGRVRLNLKDRLSRLTYVEACRLLGDQGKELIREGGKYEIDVDEQVHLGEDLFRLKLLDAVVTITPMAEAWHRLRWNCTACDQVCVHVGAALALILEEKTALGLAVAPPEQEPVETLSEEEVVRQAIAERQERAETERMRIKPAEPGKVWTDYIVTSVVSGKTYRVALRGWQPGESYCSCPDFRKNTLGTCKHVLKVTAWVRRRFPAGALKRPYRPKDLAVYVRYGQELELRLLVPPDPPAGTASLVQRLRDRAIEDVPDLLGRVRKLEALGQPVTIYPDAEEYINHRLFQARVAAKVTEIRKDPAGHPLRRTLLKAELLPYQLDGIAFAAGAGRAILADDMGLGKTIQGIGVAEFLAGEARIGKVLIICPTSLKSQWRNEIHRFSSRDCQLILGPAAERAGQYDNPCFFTICNYEQVLRDILAIERVKWDLIILDEGQRIKNWEAKTSRVVKGLRSPFALVLSGTPLENRLDDLYSVVEFIDDRRLGPAFRFMHRHRVTDERGKVLGYRNLTALREQLKPVLLRRTRASVMQQLPPRSTEIIRIAPTAEQLDIHGAQMQVVSSIVHKKFLTEMDLLRLQKALLLCRMSADSTYLVDKEEPGYSSKLEQLDGLLAQLLDEDERKILLFSEWTTMLGLIEPLLEKRQAKFVRLDGSIPQKRRQTLVNAFQQDPTCKLFITTNAGATGLNLQAANTVVNVDLPWNPAVLEQRIARAHRMGQRRPVQVFVLVTEQTIEENLLGTLSAKHELALAALDPESEVDAVDLASGMEELRRRLEVLLGTRPAAPVDESQQRSVAAEAERLGRQERVAAAGGQLIQAAFQFLGELVPEPADPAAAGRMADLIQQQLSECVSQETDGQVKLTLTLADNTAMSGLVNSLVRLLSLGSQPRP